MTARGHTIRYKSGMDKKEVIDIVWFLLHIIM